MPGNNSPGPSWPLCSSLPIRFGRTLSSFSTVFFNHSAAEEYFEGKQITASKHECAHLLLGNLSCPNRLYAPNFCPIRPVCGTARARDYAADYTNVYFKPTRYANVTRYGTRIVRACGRVHLDPGNTLESC